MTLRDIARPGFSGLLNLYFRVDVVSGKALAAGADEPAASALPLTNPNSCV